MAHNCHNYISFGMRSYQTKVYRDSTVDGKNPPNQLRLVVYPTVYNGLYTCQVVIAGFLPSTDVILTVVTDEIWI